MTKATSTVLVIGGVLVLGVGGVIAYLSARKSALAMPPYLGPPPPPPPQSLTGDIQTIGSSLLYEGGKALSALGHNEVVTTLTGGENAKSYLVKSALTGGAYVPVKAGISLFKKLF